MLTLTDSARTVVEDLTTNAGLPETGGLRIAESLADVGTLELALVTAPGPDDEIVLAGAAHVFVAPEATQLLADKSLDAEPVEGGMGFTLAPQS